MEIAQLNVAYYNEMLSEYRRGSLAIEDGRAKGGETTGGETGTAYGGRLPAGSQRPSMTVRSKRNAILPLPCATGDSEDLYYSEDLCRPLTSVLL